MNKKEVKDKIDRILELFFHVKEKDVFEIYYKKLLLKRLIYKKSLSDEIE